MLEAFVLAATAALAGPVEIEPESVPIGGIAVVRVTGESEPRATFEGKALRFFRSGGHWVALVGIDLDHRPGRAVLRVERPGDPIVRRLSVVSRKFPEERLTVPKTYTELDPATLERVRAEKQLLDGLWPNSAAERLWNGAFAKPADGPAGSPFGLRRFFNGEPRSPHAGIDFRAPLGAPVRAANAGRVVLARELFFTGNTVVLDHGLGVFTLYVHLSTLGVRPGDAVSKEAEIGKVGATGRATGPHLHFAMRIGDARVDPAMLLGRNVD